MAKEELISLNTITNNNGSLTTIEELENIPFKIQRVFYIYDCKQDSIRGNHANKKSKFVLICINGSVQVSVDNGITCTEYTLSDKNTGLYIPQGLWKKMYNFSNDAILLCLSDCQYDKSEYIYDYQNFLKERT